MGGRLHTSRSEMHTPRDLGMSRSNLTDEKTSILEFREIGNCPSGREVITCLHGHLQSSERSHLHNRELRHHRW